MSTERSQPARRIGGLKLFPDPWYLLLRYTIILGTLSLLGFCGRTHWLVQLACHFRVQYTFAALILLAISYKRGFRSLALLNCLTLVINTATIFPYVALAKGAVGLAPSDFKLVHLNVHTENTSYDRVLSFLRSEHADFVFLLEVNGTWRRQLQQLNTLYPVIRAEPRSDNFGVEFLSKTSDVDVSLPIIGFGEIPSVHATVRIRQKTVHMIATHPVPPVGPTHAALRRRHLTHLADTISGISDPLIVVGDLNCTPFAPEFDDLLSSGRILDASRVWGLSLTWPAPIWPVLIPIDHVLFRPEVVVTDLHLGPYVGSDHYPVVASVRIE